MKNVAQLIDSAAAASIQYRRKAYGASGIREFLRDALAMANAPVKGPRHIIIGVDADSRGGKVVDAVSDEDFDHSPDYVLLAKEHIEPAIDISYEATLLDGKQVGVFEIGDCRERPYMMRVGYSETLRLGDAYMRVDNTAVKLGRTQLQALFQQNFQTSVSADNVEIGFAGIKISKDLRLACRDLSQLPSSIATAKLEELMKAQAVQHAPGSTSMVARLAHARLYGSDEPYVSRSPEELILEMDQVGFKYAEQDKEFLFGAGAQTLQIQIRNHGSEPITDAKLAVLLPRDGEFLVRAGSSNVDTAYPVVRLQDNATRITQKIGTIPIGETIDVFAEPLRVFAGKALQGRKFGIRYALNGQNLRTAAQGRLRMLFSP